MAPRERPYLTEGRLSTVAVIVTLIALVAWSSWGIARRVAELRPQPLPHGDSRCVVMATRGGAADIVPCTWAETHVPQAPTCVRYADTSGWSGRVCPVASDGTSNAVVRR